MIAPRVSVCYRYLFRYVLARLSALSYDAVPPGPTYRRLTTPDHTASGHLNLPSSGRPCRAFAQCFAVTASRDGHRWAHHAKRTRRSGSRLLGRWCIRGRTVGYDVFVAGIIARASSSLSSSRATIRPGHVLHPLDLARRSYAGCDALPSNPSALNPGGGPRGRHLRPPRATFQARSEVHSRSVMR